MRNPLALLIWLRIRAWFRRLGKNLGTTRGKVFFLLGAGALLLWILSR